MSGITGLVGRVKSAVDTATLEALLDDLTARGPDGSDSAVNGRAGLGHQQLITTPEAEYESQPEETDQYLLTADARVDNRAELESKVDATADPVVTDADLILAAYDRWGRDCPKRLVGAFAFAIWDKDEQRLFCARDHVGLRPFFYADTDDVFAFASEPGALVNREFVPDELDELAVSDFLLGFRKASERTLYSGVRALPPAHWVVVDTDGIEIQQYWSLDGPELEFESDEAYLQEFRSRFREAVRARLRTPEGTRVGSLLSGGLDSSSIACLANDMTDGPLPTFSVTYDDIPASDEREYIDAVHEHREFDSHFVRGDQHSPFEHADAMLERIGEPFVANTLYLHWELYRAAADENVRVVLDGHGGDQTISKGLARFSELLVSGHPVQALRESASYADRYDKTMRWVLYRHLLTRLETDSLRTLRLAVRDTTDPVGRHSDVVDEAFSDRIDLSGRAQRLESRPQRTTRAEHRRLLDVDMQSSDCELANISAATFGIEPRFPFFDRRVMEFCFRAPGRLKLRNGWRRWLLRNALSETLPPTVRDRTTKGNLAHAYYETLRSRDRDELDALFTADQFPPYLDRERVQSEWRAFLDGDESNVLANVWRPALLCKWFDLTDRYD